MRTPARPVRLLMLSHYFAERGGGIELVAAALARALTTAGFELVWLATGGVQDNGPQSSYRKVALAASGAAEKLLRIPYPLLWPSAWRTILREAARTDVVLIHDALYLTSIVGHLAARIHRKPVAVVQHVGFVPYTSAVLRGLMQAANRYIAAPLLRRADRVIFISEVTLRYFARIAWRRPPRVIFNGVDTATFSPALTSDEIAAARRNLGLPVEGPIALFVGRFIEKKGLHVLEGMARVRPDVLFVLAGNGRLNPHDWQLPNARVYAGLSGATLARLYRASDLLLLPSAGEGFPLVVQEALACGLPIICGTDSASADPRATPFLRAVAVDLADPERTARLFSEEMTRVLARRETLADRRARFTFAEASYSWEHAAAAYAAVVRELCSA
jgi:glycosyltransferase involved in cell wall biosynthesis